MCEAVCQKQAVLGRDQNYFWHKMTAYEILFQNRLFDIDRT